MNIFQSLNAAASFFIFAGLMTGVEHQVDKVSGDPIEYFWQHKSFLILILFIIVFRLKMMFDDHRHFAEAHQDKNNFRLVGFLLAVGTWAFWVLAAYEVAANAQRSCEFLIISFLTSTAWILVHLFEIAVDGHRRFFERAIVALREWWVTANFLYIIVLACYVGLLPMAIGGGHIGELMFLLVILAVDVVKSKSFIGLLGPAPESLKAFPRG